MTTRAEARDDLMALIKTALDDASITHVNWPGLPAPAAPGAEDTWARVSMQHNLGFQATLGRVAGLRRYRRLGVVHVELYAPTGDGLSTEDVAGKKVLDVLKAARTANGLITRKATARETGPDGGWHRTVVQAEFEYDEVS